MPLGTQVILLIGLLYIIFPAHFHSAYHDVSPYLHKFKHHIMQTVQEFKTGDVSRESYATLGCFVIFLLWIFEFDVFATVSRIISFFFRIFLFAFGIFPLAMNILLTVIFLNPVVLICLVGYLIYNFGFSPYQFYYDIHRYYGN